VEGGKGDGGLHMVVAEGEGDCLNADTHAKRCCTVSIGDKNEREAG